MGGQLESLNERVSAHVAHKVPLPSVDPSVDGQRIGSLEGFLADVALIRPSVAVRHSVPFVQISRPEKLSAHFTLIKRLRQGIKMLLLALRLFGFFHVVVRTVFGQTLNLGATNISSRVIFTLVRRRIILFFFYRV